MVRFVLNAISNYLSRDYLATQWENVRDEVRNLTKIPANWDGEGADPVKHELIAPTIQLLRLAERNGYPIPLYVYLTAAGTIMVEWHLSNDRVLAANIRSDDSVEIIDRCSQEITMVRLALPVSKKESDVTFTKLLITTFVYFPGVMLALPFVWFVFLLIVITYPIFYAAKKSLDYLESFKT